MLAILAALLLQGLVPVDVAGVCHGLQNSHDCAVLVEQAQLPRYRSLVQRSGRELRFHTEAGLVVLQDEGRFNYKFHSCDQEANWCTAIKGANEYLGFVTLQLRDGQTHVTPTQPIRSPTGNYVALGSTWDLYLEGFLEIRDAKTFEALARWSVIDLIAQCKGQGVEDSTAGASPGSWTNEGQFQFELHCEQESIPYQADRGDDNRWSIAPISTERMPTP